MKPLTQREILTITLTHNSAFSCVIYSKGNGYVDSIAVIIIFMNYNFEAWQVTYVPDNLKTFTTICLKCTLSVAFLRYVQSERRYWSTKSRNFPHVCLVGDTNMPPIIKPSVKFGEFAELYIFASFQQITFKLGNLTNCMGYFQPC